MAESSSKAAEVGGDLLHHPIGRKTQRLNTILVIVTVVNVVLSLSTLILLAVVTANAARYARDMPVITSDMTKLAVHKITEDKSLMRNVMNMAVENLLSQENMDAIMEKMPFILGDPNANLPAQLAKAFVTELPFIVQYANDGLKHLEDVLESVSADVEALENEDLKNFFEYVLPDLQQAIEKGQNVVNVMSKTFGSSDKASERERIRNLEPVSGFGGMVLSMLGLLPDRSSEGKVVYPLLKWYQTQVDGPKLAPLFESCESFLGDVLQGPYTQNSGNFTFTDKSSDYSYRYYSDNYFTCEQRASYNNLPGVNKGTLQCTSNATVLHEEETSGEEYGSYYGEPYGEDDQYPVIACQCTWRSESIADWLLYLCPDYYYYGYCYGSGISGLEIRDELQNIKEGCKHVATALSSLK